MAIAITILGLLIIGAIIGSALNFAGVFFAISGGVMLLLDLWLLFTGRMADDQLVMIQESEDVAALQHATHDAPKPR